MNIEKEMTRVSRKYAPKKELLPENDPVSFLIYTGIVLGVGFIAGVVFGRLL